jgi:hypothetical protein
VEEARDLQRATTYYHHECILQISGPSDSEMLLLSRKISGGTGSRSYKIVCNCSDCLSYKEEVRSGNFPTTEPLVKCLAIVFNLLVTFGYSLTTTSSVQNGDGSSSTTYVWIKGKRSSDL